MLIIEQIFLVGINEKSKKIWFDWKEYLFYGAILIDLVLKEKISITKDLNPDRKSSTTRLIIEILNKDSTNNTILDKMLQFIESNGEKNSLTEVLFKFVKRSNYSEFREVLISNFESKGLIQYLGKKKFKRKYQATEPGIKTKILDEINAVIFDNQEPTKELTFLLSLLNIEYNIRKLIPRKSVKIAEERILKLLEDDVIGWQVQSVITDMIISLED